MFPPLVFTWQKQSLGIDLAYLDTDILLFFMIRFRFDFKTLTQFLPYDEMKWR